MPSGVNMFYDIIVLYFLKDYWKLLEKKKKLEEEDKRSKEENKNLKKQIEKKEKFENDFVNLGKSYFYFFFYLFLL
jgi:hypothetical protein